MQRILKVLSLTDAIGKVAYDALIPTEA